MLKDLLESVLKALEEKGKSKDIADLLMELASKVPAPSATHDLLVEFSLTANPDEEEGSECKSLSELKEQLAEYLETE